MKRLIAALGLSALALSASADALEDALKLYDSGRFPQAAAALQPLAAHGNPVAQRKLGLLYYFGNGVKEDELKAVELFKKAAEQGDTEAMYHLGVALTFGNQAATASTDPDADAARWYFAAAQKGHAEAQYALGLMFLSGKGVVRSNEEAQKWIGRAAQQGHQEAKNFMSGQSPHGK